MIWEVDGVRIAKNTSRRNQLAAGGSIEVHRFDHFSLGLRNQFFCIIVQGMKNDALGITYGPEAASNSKYRS